MSDSHPPTDRTLSRRQMLAGLGGLAALIGCGGVAGGLWLAGRALAERDAAGRVVVVTATPPPTTAPGPVIVARQAWGALPPDHTAWAENGFYGPDNIEGWRIYTEPLPQVYQTVVIHHSVIDEGDDLRTLAEIQRTHRADRGWADVAYHYFVAQSGIIYAGRDLHARGAHVGGYNTGSVGVCLLGDFTRMEPTPAQLSNARDLVVWLARSLALTHLAGHSAFNAETVCPGPNLARYLDDLASAAGLLRGAGGYIAPQPPTAVP